MGPRLEKVGLKLEKVGPKLEKMGPKLEKMGPKIHFFLVRAGNLPQKWARKKPVTPYIFKTQF